jgi:hypothetical protein
MVNKFMRVIFFLTVLCISFLTFSADVFGMSVKVKTYVVIPKSEAASGPSAGLQQTAIKRAIMLSVKTAVKRLIGKKIFLKKQTGIILKKNIYPNGQKYIYSFKVLKSGEYLNLYYISIKTHIRAGSLTNALKTLGFHILKTEHSGKKAVYGVYYVKFTGSFNNEDSNLFQKLMIKYSHHLKNLYISSFSENYDEIKVLYYGSIVRLLKRVDFIIKSYLDAKITTADNNTVTINVIGGKAGKKTP